MVTRSLELLESAKNDFKRYIKQSGYKSNEEVLVALRNRRIDRKEVDKLVLGMGDALPEKHVKAINLGYRSTGLLDIGASVIIEKELERYKNWHNVKTNKVTVNTILNRSVPANKLSRAIERYPDRIPEKLLLPIMLNYSNKDLEARLCGNTLSERAERKLEERISAEAEKKLEEHEERISAKRKKDMEELGIRISVETEKMRKEKEGIKMVEMFMEHPEKFEEFLKLPGIEYENK